MPPSNAPRTSDAVIYLPGIMGSELVDSRGKIVWGFRARLLFRQIFFRDALERLALTGDDDIHASQPVRFPSSLPYLTSIEPYTALEHRLKTVVFRPEAVLPFAYDWRRSTTDASEKLARTARMHLSEWRKRWRTLPAEETAGFDEPQLTLVAHSMGGLVASHFAAFGDGGETVRKIVTLGTPFAGSLNAIRVLASGKQLPLNIFASSLRDAGRTFPGLYELIARWKCVMDGDDLRKPTAGDIAGVGADSSLANQAFKKAQKLADAFAGQVGNVPPVRCLVGTTQPTRQSVRFERGEPEFYEEIGGTDHRGDGTVFRFSASPSGIEPAYLPQKHGQLAKKREATEFVAAVLTESDLGEFMAPPGVGLRAPSIVKVGEPFEVEVLDADPGIMCQLTEADSDSLLSMVQAEKRDGLIKATFVYNEPGLVRAGVASGGFSEVEQLIAVCD